MTGDARQPVESKFAVQTQHSPGSVHHRVKAIAISGMRAREWVNLEGWEHGSKQFLRVACRANRAAATPRFLALN